MKVQGLAALAAFAVMGAAMGSSGAIARERPADPASLMRSAARCVAENSPREVAALLETLPGSREEARIARKTDTDFQACAENSWKLKMANFADARARLAVAMVAEREAGAPRMDSSPWYKAAAAGRTPGTGYDPALLGRQEFGTCVAAAAPEAAANLVRAIPNSSDEHAAMGRLRAVVAPCIPRDMPAHFDADMLRDLLAEPVYHAMVGR